MEVKDMTPDERLKMGLALVGRCIAKGLVAATAPAKSQWVLLEQFDKSMQQLDWFGSEIPVPERNEDGSVK